ncbi:MAG: sugar-binding protein [Planctomycetota bacterium]
MRTRITWPLMMIALLTAGALAAPEVPVDVTDAQIAEIVASAPSVPVDLGLGLDLTLVDYIDCTDGHDPHPMIDQGTSGIATGPAGRYRVTGQGRHQFFAYRWRAAARDVPHVLVIEYPDDAQRSICFFTHESPLSGRANIDWSLETGVYTGNPLPITNEMQYHTMFFWPTDSWPAVIVGNWIRDGAPAAASRIWVFRVEGDRLPPLDVEDPDPTNPRILGDLYNWALVPVRGAFGLTRQASAFDHIAEYYAYLGCNVVSWPVVSNNAWGFRCLIPAWDGGDKEDQDWLTGILDACERHDVKFIGTFEMGRGFTIDGKKPTAEHREAYREGLLKGFAQFLDRYGDSPALQGIAFGTPDFGPEYGNATVDIINECFDGGMAEFTAFIHAHKPDLKIYTFVGAQDLHDQYFKDFPGVMRRWEASDTPWDEHLADEALALWKQWGRDPGDLAAVGGLTTVYQYQPDDHAIYDSYAQQGRAMGYYDLDTSAPKAANVDTRAVMLWNTFYEGWLGLHPETNFWYRKLWVAPDFNASEPYASAAWARAMEHRDRNVIIAGAWNRKAGGHEATYRRFARAYRALPPVEMTDVPVDGGGSVLVRRGVYKDRTYVSVLNTTPVAQAAAVTLGGRTEMLALAPCEMTALSADGDVAVEAEATASQEYTRWLTRRLGDYNRVMARVEQLEPAAVPEAYKAHSRRAQELFDAGAYRRADLALGFGLTEELKLRRRVLKPPAARVAKVDPEAIGPDLDAWPDDAMEVLANDGRFLAAHLYFRNSWTGPDDLSSRIRIAHDGTRLYFGLAVRDDTLIDKDALSIFLSPANYRVWLVDEGETATYELPYAISLPVGDATTATTTGRHDFTAEARRTDGGYVVVASLDLTDLDLTDHRLGCSIQVADHDGEEGVAKHSWAKDAVMVIPYAPVHAYWSDARTCGELILGD